ncbi:MAG TPA: hypothetical protein VGI21_08735 [Streptosporangiaceae bacterium]|jgi:hypothetical protein
MENRTGRVTPVTTCPAWCASDHGTEPMHAGITELGDDLAVIVGSAPGDGATVDIIGAPCETSEGGVTLPATAAAHLGAVLSAVSGERVMRVTQRQLDSIIAARMAREARRYQAQIEQLQQALRECAAGLVPA